MVSYSTLKILIKIEEKYRYKQNIHQNEERPKLLIFHPKTRKKENIKIFLKLYFGTYLCHQYIKLKIQDGDI